MTLSWNFDLTSCWCYYSENVYNYHKTWGSLESTEGFSNTINFISYKAARANARKVIKGVKRESWHSYVVTVNFHTLLWEVWATVNKVRRNKKSFHVPNFQHRGRNLNTPTDIANLLDRTFQENIATDNYTPGFQQRKVREELRRLTFEDHTYHDYNSQFHFDDLIWALAACTGSNPGPFGISYDLIQHLPEEGLRKVLAMFNEIWTSRTFPDSWRFAHVISIPKRNRDKCNLLNYRPISLKVKPRIVFYLKSNNLLSDQQCGARSFRFTLDH